MLAGQRKDVPENKPGVQVWRDHQHPLEIGDGVLEITLKSPRHPTPLHRGRESRVDLQRRVER